MKKFHEFGIFYDMPEGEYHADPSLSATGIRNLMVSPLNFWIKSVHNPNYVSEETAARMEGRAWHKRILEPSHYNTDVAIAPTCDKRTKEGKLEWETFNLLNKKKIIISQDIANQIEIGAKSIENNTFIQSMLLNGASEVSVFWKDEETDVRMKARLDYFSSACIIEIKTFANQKSREPHKEIMRHMAEYNYGIQAQCYLDAMRGKEKFWFIFLQKGNVPHLIVKEFTPGTTYFSITQMQYRSAIQTYKECVEKWGYDNPWVERVIPSAFEDDEFPLWAFN